MTPHDHRTFVPGCYRCELGRDEAREDLDLRRAVALAMAYAGDCMNDVADAIDQEIWDELHVDGLLREVRDYTGGGTSITTDAGKTVLLAALALDDHGTPAEGQTGAPNA